MLRDTLTKLPELPATERVHIALWDSLTPPCRKPSSISRLSSALNSTAALLSTSLTRRQPFPGTRCVGSSSGERENRVLFSARKRQQSYSTPATGTRDSALRLVEPLPRKSTGCSQVSPRPDSRTLRSTRPRLR